jgi:hypothetical protein
MLGGDDGEAPDEVEVEDDDDDDTVDEDPPEVRIRTCNHFQIITANLRTHKRMVHT